MKNTSNAESEVPLPEDQRYIVFVDPIGTRWALPYEEAKTWDVCSYMINLVNLLRCDID